MNIFAEPIVEVLNKLSTIEPFPDLAIAQCAIRMDEATPYLLAVLERAADGEELSRQEEVLLFRGVHMLGGNRREKAFQPMLRLLAQDPDRVDFLLGDAITETLPKIAAGMFDGDTAALLSAITANTIDEFVRNSLIGAAAFLAFDGRIDRDEMSRFLERFGRERLAPAGDHVWTGWAEAVAFLGLSELSPLVKVAFDEDLIDKTSMLPSHFQADLDWALRDPGDPKRIERSNLGYIEDALEAQLWTRHWKAEDDDFASDNQAELEMADLLREHPAVNAHRNVGRNDPCPCGSGKKYKKCCLA